MGHTRRPARLADIATEAGDAGGVALANHRFHRLIGEMAANPYLMACLDRLLIDHTRLSQTFYRPASEAEQALIDHCAAKLSDFKVPRAVHFVDDRLAAYERMWDGCGCKIDYFA